LTIKDNTGTEPPLLHTYTCHLPGCAIDFSEDTAKRLCRMYGDPHVHTFDGNKYDFYGHGNYWIVKSDYIWVQGRYQPRWLSKPGRTWTSKLAFGGPSLQNNTMMIEASTAWWNGEKGILGFNADSSWTGMNGKVTLVFSAAKKQVTVDLHPEIKIVITLASLSYRGRIAVPVFSDLLIGMRQIKNQKGICGDFHGLPKSKKEAYAFKVSKSEALIPY